MKSGKSLKIVLRAERLEMMKKKFLLFYPNCCSNGEKDEIYSRFGVSKKAIGISEPMDIYQYLTEDIKEILIDEVQFISANSEQAEDLLTFVKHCEKNEINLVFAAISTDFKNDSFLSVEKLMPYCDTIVRLYSVCEICHNEKGNKNVRFKNGVPSKYTEEVLIPRDNKEYTYKSICTKCFYELYK